VTTEDCLLKSICIRLLHFLHKLVESCHRQPELLCVSSDDTESLELQIQTQDALEAAVEADDRDKLEQHLEAHEAQVRHYAVLAVLSHCLLFCSNANQYQLRKAMSLLSMCSHYKFALPSSPQ